jgi:ABC-type transport system involved in multi-copper enzyme maturation permease subunit
MATETERPAATGSALRAWWELVLLSVRRQAQLRVMLIISLTVLAGLALMVALNTQFRGWHLFRESTLQRLMKYPAVQVSPVPLGVTQAAEAAVSAVLLHPSSPVLMFSKSVVYTVFLRFLLPLWSLSFATQALGGEREGRTTVWLVTRPLPRSSIYLAKYVALLPWALGLNLGGFAVLCLAAGEPGRVALGLYWPAVVWGTLAFTALFHLLGATVRRPAVVGLIYAFVLEAFLSDLPFAMKRLSVSFYTRCLMFDEYFQRYGLPPTDPEVYGAVGPTAAVVTLAAATVGLTAFGMLWFSRAEPGEDV